MHANRANGSRTRMAKMVEWQNGKMAKWHYDNKKKDEAKKSGEVRPSR